MLSSIFTAALALPLLALGTPAPAGYGYGLPPCSDKYVPCSCPSGTVFKNITSFGIVGAPAKDLGVVMNDFWSTEWFGLTSFNVTGQKNVPGATRMFNISSHGAYYYLEEHLVSRSIYADGSFQQKYSLLKYPVIVPAAMGGGEYHGFWATMDVQQTLIANESAVAYSVFRCDVGTPFATAPIHEANIKNVSAILTAQGLHTGVDIAPFSINYA